MALTKLEKLGPDGKRIYRIWKNMRKRCYAPHHERYKNYGARGIKICDEWQDPWAFYYWSMDNGYKDGLTIDRIDVDKDYEPENCQWITIKEQQHNRTDTRYETIDGITKSFAEWCEEYKMRPSTVWMRLKRNPNMTFEQALKMQPLHKSNTTKYITIDGITKSKIEWCDDYGISTSGIERRMRVHGITFEEALKMTKRYA